MSLLQSLLLKLGMLAVTLGVVFWIGWHASDTSRQGMDAEPAVGEQAAVPEQDRSDAAPQHEQIVSPPQQGAPSEPVGREARQQPTNRVQSAPLDLDRASAEELQALPGIGPVLAQRVVEYRNSAGGFRRVEDLRQVKGIGAKKFDRVRTLVSVTVGAVSSERKRAL